MQNSLNISIPAIPWQAKISGFIVNFRDELKAPRGASSPFQKLPKKEFSKEAALMTFVILVFTLLSILGSSITFYEHVCRDVKRKKKSKINKKENSMNINIGSKKASFEDLKCFLKFFCIVRNGRRILSIESLEDQIDCIEGLRFFCSSWIILYHITLFYFITIGNMEQAKPFLELKVSQLFLNIDYAVDAFFVISGFLNAHYFFGLYSNEKINWTYFYLKRYVRLTPVYLIVIGFYTNLYSYTGTGSLWPTFTTNPVCRKSWWKFTIYINNYDESALECMVWCWHLAVDMQLYTVSPLIFILLIRRPRIGIFLIFICIVGSCAASFLVTYWLDLTIGLSQIGLHLTDVRPLYRKIFYSMSVLHAQPYLRLCSYLFGIFLGHFFYKSDLKKNPIRNHKVFLWCGWITTAFCMWISFFIFHNKNIGLMEAALHNATKSLFPSFCAAWIIYVCLTGQAGFLNSCLSWRVLFPFARLSYCTNLINLIIIFRMFHQAEELMNFSIMTLMKLFAYTCVLTYPVSFIVSLLFEMPTLNLLDSFSKKKGRTYMHCSYSKKHTDNYKTS